MESPTPHFAPEPLGPRENHAGPYNFDMGYYEGVTEEHARMMSHEELVDNLRKQNIKWVEARLESNAKAMAKTLPVVDKIRDAIGHKLDAEHRAERRARRDHR